MNDKVVVRDHYGNTALITACVNQEDLSTISALCEAGDAVVNYRNKRDETALLNACAYECSDDVIKYLFERTSAANINRWDAHHDSALDKVVCVMGNIELAKWMIKNGAELAYLSTEGFATLLQSTTEEDEIFEDVGVEKNRMLELACQQGQLKWAKVIIFSGVEPNVLSIAALEYLRSAFRLAIYQNQDDSAQCAAILPKLENVYQQKMANLSDDELEALVEAQMQKANVDGAAQGKEIVVKRKLGMSPEMKL